MQPNNPGVSQQQPQFAPPGGGYQPFTHGGFGIPTEVPGAGTAQICGIVGIVLFFNLIGVACSIIAIVKAGSAMNAYNMNPGRYTAASFRKARAGKTCGIVGLSLFGFAIVVVMLCIAAFA